ncbi:coiled-coil domain-containing protein 121 [Phodopus roborovskii]|uniref:Gm6583 protein n=1 Tax=Phodopus roborovskii TaxID=109678 RepID=A0AAU9YVL4_PHORO|nr:coiled-coil domain-containing protein 121 [Phodopus roborovskii]CAH6778724.1 Gm6583 [Phodopus roborovskii]
MESQGQDLTTWDTRNRRPTLFYHNQGGGAAGPPSLPARKEEPAFTYESVYHRPCLARKKAICDFRVRWPELVLLAQKKKEEGLPLIGQSLSDRQVHEASACSSEVSISNLDLESSPSEGLDSTGGSAVSSQPPHTESAHMTILNSYLRPESMTRLEKRVRRKTVVAMNDLGQEIEAVKSRRSVLMMDIKELKKEMAWEETETKPFLERLRQKEEESQRKYDSLWKDYIQQCQEVKDRRQELVSAFASRTTNLQKQLLRSRKMEVGFRRKLKALRPVAQVKESQDQKIQALEQEEASIVADIPFMDREAHLQFLKDKAALEKQVEELNLLESGEGITRELKKKAKALAAVAKQAHKDFCQGINAENRCLQTQLQQLDREFRELETRKEELEQGKQRWKEQQWYLEALARGRQRLQRREYGPPKPQAAPHPTQGRLLEARPKTNPK